MSKKKIVLCITIVVNIILAAVLAVRIKDASEELVRVYIENDDLKPTAVSQSFERESYGDVAVMARSGRVGEEVREEDREMYLMGEYADLSFMEKIYECCGDKAALAKCRQRLEQIRSEAGDQQVTEKIDRTVEKAVRE